MNHTDHVALLREGVAGPGGVWADFGSGHGAFTLALADLIGPGGIIYSVDQDGGVLRSQERRVREQFPGVAVQYQVADFTRRLDLPALDGIVMANALHFVRDKAPVLDLLYGYLRPGGRLLLVEYDTDRGNTWVPYPLSIGMWVRLAARHGFADTRQLATVPSRFLGRIYSAASERPAGT